MKSLFKYFVLSANLVSFSFFASLPASAKETAFTRMLINKVMAYQKAPKDKGNQAFVDAYIPEASMKDKEEMRKLIVGSQFPEMKYVGENKVQVSVGDQAATVEFVGGFEKHQMLINGKLFTFDLTKSLSENHQNMVKLFEAQGKVSWLNWLMPEANAASMSSGMAWFLLIAGVALLGWGIYSMVTSSKANGGGGGSNNHAQPTKPNAGIDNDGKGALGAPPGEALGSRATLADIPALPTDSALTNPPRKSEEKKVTTKSGDSMKGTQMAPPPGFTFAEPDDPEAQLVQVPGPGPNNMMTISVKKLSASK